MDERIRKKVDELMNCEDIAFNMLVSHMTRQAPIKVTSRETISHDKRSSSISRKIDHNQKRSECINYFVSIYGYNPLLNSQFRADSVLYNAELASGIQKCFRFV